ARGRLPRRGRPRLVPVREAVGARALPAARCRGPAGPHRRSFPQGLVWFRGRLHPLPDGFQLLAPTRLAPFATSSLFSWRGKARMALDLVLPRGGGALGGGDDESLGAFVRRRLGAEALERVAQPLVWGI